MGGFLDVLSKVSGLIPGAGPLISAGLDVAGGVIGGRAVGKAANAELGAVNEGLDETRASGGRAQDLARGFYNDVQWGNEPYTQAGRTAAGQLGDLTKPGGELDAYTPGQLKPDQYSGQLPDFHFDPSQVQMDPGYAFRLQEGNKALLAGRAAGGVLGSGATTKALERYNQDLASQEYQNAYGRSYQSQSDTFKSQQQQAADIKDTFEGNRAANTDAFKTNQAAIEKSQQARFDRLAEVQKMGQTATSDTNAAAKTFGTSAINTENQTGQNITDLLLQRGNVNAGGIIGKANAVTGTLGNLNERLTLSQLNRKRPRNQ